MRSPPDSQLQPVITGWYAEFDALERAPGGVVNYVSKAPSAQRTTDLEGSIGSFDSKQFSISQTGALGDHADFRVTLGAKDAGGSRDFEVSKAESVLAVL